MDGIQPQLDGITEAISDSTDVNCDYNKLSLELSDKVCGF